MHLALQVYFFGTVTRINPLEINVEQRFTITKEFLILTKNVKDYNVNVSVDWNTDNRTVEGTSHFHNINGTKTITIHNALKQGDEVILLQVQGGQKFIVLDKAG